MWTKIKCHIFYEPPCGLVPIWSVCLLFPVYHHQAGVVDVSATCRRCSGTMSSIDRASDCSSSLSTSSNAVFATASGQIFVSKNDLCSKDDLRCCFSGEQIGTTDCTDRLNNSDNWHSFNSLASCAFLKFLAEWKIVCKSLSCSNIFVQKCKIWDRKTAILGNFRCKVEIFEHL